MQTKRRQFFDSLAFKIGAIIVLTEVVILGITGSLYIRNFNTEIDQGIEKSLLLPAALLSKGILQLDVVADEKQMQQLVGEDLTNAFVIGVNDNIFFSLNSEYAGRLVKEVPAIDPALLAQGAAAATVTRAQSGLYVSVSPLFGPDERSVRFYLYITADGSAAQARKANNAQLFIIGSLATILATCVIILIAFNVTIFRPLGRVLGVFRQVEAGNLTAQIRPANSRDELGDLARAFNHMAAQLRQTLDTLRREHDLIERIMETSPASITMVNREGQVTFANPQAEQVLGLTKDEISQRTYNAPEWRITDFAGGLFPDEKLPFRQVMATRQPVYDVQHAIEWPDGRRVFLSINGAPLLNQSGEIESVVFTLEDITERKRADEELRAHRDRLEDLVRERTAELIVAKDAAEEARRLAEAASQAKSAFLANMSHELRTPLNAILGYAQILQRRPLDSDVVNALNTVQRSGEHLLTLINDILDIARIEASRLELFPIPIHFPGFLDHIASIIRSRAEAKGLTFTFEKLGAIPVGVQADETRLRQVLLNLLDNAVKFTDQGEVVLSVGVCEYESEAPSHPYAPTLRFSVRDTGIGIPPDQLERIFQPFEQVGHATRWTSGTGLGLAISHQLVHLMGGDLQVESQVDRGSTFWFEIVLPVTEMAMEATQPPERTISGYQGPRRTVLVVDDVPSNRAILVDLLQPLGFEIVEAVDGQQALHLAQELRPDLILMDRWMPTLDGFEAAQRMRQMPELREASIVTVSASVSQEDQAQSREVGIDAFLPKPVSWPRLAALLQECLALEWEYEEQRSGGAEEQERRLSPAPLVPPPAKEMVILLDLARRGNMRAIQERAAHVETLGEQYVPFARKLHELAERFEERQIRTLIGRYMEEDQ